MEPAALFAGLREHLADRGPEPERAVTDREHRRGHVEVVVGRQAGVAGVTGGVTVVGYTGDTTAAAYQMISGSWFTGPGQAVVPPGS